MSAGALNDRGILLFAGEVIEVHHQLKVGIVDRFHEAQSFGGRVDDVGLLVTQRFDRDRDAACPGFRSDPAAEVDQLLERLVL